MNSFCNTVSVIVMQINLVVVVVVVSFLLKSHQRADKKVNWISLRPLQPSII